MRWPKVIVGLLLLLVPWPLFILAAKEPGPMLTISLILTLAVSAFGLMILIGGTRK